MSKTSSENCESRELANDELAHVAGGKPNDEAKLALAFANVALVNGDFFGYLSYMADYRAAIR